VDEIINDLCESRLITSRTIVTEAWRPCGTLITVTLGDAGLPPHCDGVISVPSNLVPRDCDVTIEAGDGDGVGIKTREGASIDDGTDSAFHEHGSAAL
jgi:hypothetical protein